MRAEAHTHQSYNYTFEPTNGVVSYRVSLGCVSKSPVGPCESQTAQQAVAPRSRAQATCSVWLFCHRPRAELTYESQPKHRSALSPSLRSTRSQPATHPSMQGCFVSIVSSVHASEYRQHRPHFDSGESPEHGMRAGRYVYIGGTSPSNTNTSPISRANAFVAAIDAGLGCAPSRCHAVASRLPQIAAYRHRGLASLLAVLEALQPRGCSSSVEQTTPSDSFRLQ